MTSSNVISFVPAVRQAVKSRIWIEGLPGCGKTLTGLRVLKHLCGDQPFGVLDTQGGQSRNYVGRFEDLQFSVHTPGSFSVESLTETIAAAERAGLAGLMIDSGSAYWSGLGGVMQAVDGHRDRFGSGWKAVTPLERTMIQAFQSCGMHFVMTGRVKSDYVLEQGQTADGHATTKPRKVGMKADQRDGLDYEFDLAGVMDQQTHTLTITKTVMEAIPIGSEWRTPGPEFAQLIAEHCDQGENVETPRQLAERAAAGTRFSELIAIRDEVVRRGIERAPIIDDEGQQVALIDRVLELGRIVSRAEQDQAKRDAATNAARERDTAAAAVA